MEAYSGHIFYFPFKWKIKDQSGNTLTEQIDLDKICYKPGTNWLRGSMPTLEDQVVMYNEKNFFYKFVHHTLYDMDDQDSLVRHFERKETQLSENEVFYLIKKKDREQPYKLRVNAININFYATGVGFLSFYLRNEIEEQSGPDDVLSINQYGRRIMPPFYGDIEAHIETAEYLRIEGLNERDYQEDFKSYSFGDTWKPASIITDLVEELATNIIIEPVVDDRMFVLSWYMNDALCTRYKGCLEKFMAEDMNEEEQQYKDFWYRFLYVDGSFCTCQNDEMKKDLLIKHTYPRWEKESSLYGVSRYSMVYLTNHKAPGEEHLLATFETIYARMVELVLMQRASMLRFSAEVTKVSHLSNRKVDEISIYISSLYKEYIRFVNQVYFREVTAQDQGIELYEMLQKSLKMEEYVKDLDGEIEELHQYVSLMDDRDRNRKATSLNNIAIFFLPFSVITGFWGMNKVFDIFGEDSGWGVQVIMLIAGVMIAMFLIYDRKRQL